MLKVALIDYGSGNRHSAEKALRRAADIADVEIDLQLTDNTGTIQQADRLVLPGVGAFAQCKAGLDARDGLVEALTEAAVARATPFLGICVGMQLLADYGDEGVGADGLGWIPGTVTAMPRSGDLKLPHMGWNQVTPLTDHPLLAGSGDAYFVHSYHFETAASDHTLATTTYTDTFSAVVGRDNIIGTQFHPEKSQEFGLLFLARFLTWDPS